ncbi:MAG: uroporphyrinogen-III C-methyltransferase [Rhodospirillales bacterium]|nr:uroporphyrinogen-III C-methyltransferase [Rhodospirillales bacterium]
MLAGSNVVKVFLVGAGPGDPDLLTLKAARLLTNADVVLHDSLIGPAILALIHPAADIIDVGKRCGKISTSQAEICRLLVETALTGKRVVRLKGGDPTIFGRLTEEMEALRQAKITFEVVPGVTAASAAAAALQTSLTQRNVARTLHIVTGHGAERGLPVHNWAALAQAGGTLAIYMGSKYLPGLVTKLLAAGASAELPVVAVEWASLPEQQIIRTSLVKLPEVLAKADPNGPVLLLVGLALGSI